MCYTGIWAYFRIYRLAIQKIALYVPFITILRKEDTMKIFIVSLCLFLSACATNNTPNLPTICLEKDPNTMTDREVEMCKAYLQRPVIYQN